MSKDKYCSYGRHFVPIDRIRRVRKAPGAPPTFICLACIPKRRMSREQIDKLTAEENAERLAARRAASQKALEKRKEEE